ncbi:preprotein translocase subunit SecY [Candidatus Desantisbacteria bacterium CG_4_9_14_3_um_filter_40_11]|uniref:Protein translocase subunit SecY n=3 Tax=unclassified Candidatus Desantisiibacteriota TaxID=3106372 RepID=A0A2M7JF13_9BACT|nr:MAG: preprotein translocase subunit SecY [Candidatus Desantisbacteria bacterium CG_4_8_14_3_um_filter_40_12]PIY19551.1 MAG: preprotein translocase subunit SecY [Candidatus Desantisbacteria bacterium CG_4_10_14_3_um_filter_40_18]PJB30198.1 MAG: preprotein translocase subunit SecY [Candidatus Desantisbacteria bacterium CG_4_9_14_3_um_filter_40_11]
MRLKGIENILNPFKVYELRKRILFSLAVLAIYRFGAAAPTPGVDTVALGQIFQQAKGTIIGMLDMFSGGAFEKFSVFALGIMPYISASIIMSLLTKVMPSLEKIQKEGEVGRKKINQYTRYLTLAIGIIQASGVSIWIQNMQGLQGESMVLTPGIGFHLMTIVTLTTGTAIVMWLGEQITERGIGNGASLIIFANIISQIPNGILESGKLLFTGERNPIVFIIGLAVILVAIAATVTMIQGHRKIIVQYAKRMVGRKVYGGQSTHLPLQVNMAGVIPIIFASSLLTIPATILTFFGGTGNPVMEFIVNQLTPGRGATYYVIETAAIVFFTYFYVAVIFNPVDVAENMRKYGGFVPGIRPGKPTAEHIERVLKRITFVGAIFLALINLIPSLMYGAMKIPFHFGGTSILIVVGVALDIMRRIESHLLMGHYDGFMKKGKIKGRF